MLIDLSASKKDFYKIIKCYKKLDLYKNEEFPNAVNIMEHIQTNQVFKNNKHRESI